MLLDPESRDEGDLKPAVGSLLIVKAESLSEVKSMIESDIYYTSGVVSYHVMAYSASLMIVLPPVLVSGTGKKSLYCLSFPRRPSLLDTIPWLGLFHKLSRRIYGISGNETVLCVWY